MGYTRRELPSDKAKALGARLKALRKERRLTQGEIARRLNLKAVSQVSGWETGSTPEIPNLLRLAALYGTPLDQLLFGIDAEYDVLIRRRLPLRVQGLIDDQITATLLHATEAFEGAIKTVAPSPSEATPTAAPPTARGKSAPTRARRTPKKT